MSNSTFQIKRQGRKIVEAVLALQPLFAIPLYFSVIAHNPPLWLSLLVAIIPLGLRFGLTHNFIRRTTFDVPILLFICGMLVGFIVAPNKEVAIGALSSALASILVYYGLVSNGRAGNKYWMWVAGILCVIILAMIIWFFSQGSARQLFFNRWAFKLFEGLPETSGPVLQWNGLGTLLAVAIPPFFAMAIFKNSKHLRIIALILGLVLLGALFLTVSTAGWIAVTCSLAFVFICWRLWMIGVVVPVVGSVVAVILALYDKVQWLPQILTFGAVTSRVEMWIRTIHLLTGYRIITGIGLGAWFKLYNGLYGAAEGHMHNSYIQLYTDTGILGAVALIWAVVVFVRLSRGIILSSKQNVWRGAGIGLIGSIIAGAVFACYDVTTIGIEGTASSYIYLSVPLLWVWVALFAVTQEHLDVRKEITNPVLEGKRNG